MAKPWSEVTGSADFQALSGEQQDLARRRYFDSEVAPGVPPAQRKAAWLRFASEAGYGTRSVAKGEEPTGGPTGRVRGEDIPAATAVSVLRDVGAGILQVGPTALKGVADLARLATGDRVGKGLSDAMEDGSRSIREMVGSRRAVLQREKFEQDMQDPNVSVGQVLADNKGALADQILPTIGSMLLPAGAAGLASKAATTGKAVRGLTQAQLAARANAAREGATVATTVVQNAGDTYGTIRDKGGDQDQAYLGAALTAPFTYVAGRMSGGAAEAQLAKLLARRPGAAVVPGSAAALPKAVLKEGGQELGEEAGQYVGETVGTGAEFDANAAGKRMAVAGTLGAVLGGSVHTAGKVAPRDARPSGPLARAVDGVVPPPALPAAPVEPAEPPASPPAPASAPLPPQVRAVEPGSAATIPAEAAPGAGQDATATAAPEPEPEPEPEPDAARAMHQAVADALPDGGGTADLAEQGMLARAEPPPPLAPQPQPSPELQPQPQPGPQSQPVAPASAADPDAHASTDAPADAGAGGAAAVGDILNRLGEPFTSRLPALNAARRAGEGHEVVPVPGGYAVRRVAVPEAPAQATASAGPPSPQPLAGPAHAKAPMPDAAARVDEGAAEPGPPMAADTGRPSPAGVPEAAAQGNPQQSSPPAAQPNAMAGRAADAGQGQARPGAAAGGVLEGDGLNRLGKPYTSRLPALNAAKKAGDGHEVVAVKGGYVVRRAAPAPAAQGAEQAAPQGDAQAEAAAASDEQRFAPETGTLGIPRAEMPQVPTQSHGALVNHLNAQGIAHETTTVDASSVKPTQAEYSPAKVEQAKTASGDRAVIVSSDGHIIDGHHQGLAAAEEGKPVKAIVLDAPVEQALEAVKNSPSAAARAAAAAADSAASQENSTAGEDDAATSPAVRMGDERASGAAPAAKDGEGGAAGRAADAQPDAGGPARRPDTAAPVAGVQPAVPDGGGAGQQLAGVAKKRGEKKSAAPLFSRTKDTQARFEARIDALYAGEKPNPQGVRVLDGSDLLGLLGMGSGPIHLVESKVEQGRFNHGLTAADWKKVPEWLDNPTAVFDSETSPGRLVFIGPELVRGSPVRMIVDPKPDGKGVNLLINAYDAERNPFDRWERDGLLRYVDTKKTTPVPKSFQPRLAGLPEKQGAPAPEIWQRAGGQFPRQAASQGRQKILTEKHLGGWRRANNPAFSVASPAGVGTSWRMAPGKRLSVAEVEQEVRQITKGWAKAPTVVVVENMNDPALPDAAREAQAESRGAQGAVRGVFHDGVVYLVADQLPSGPHAAITLFHEALGHFGLRGVFGDALVPSLEQIAALRQGEVKAKAKEYGLDFQSREDRLVAAEEVLAEWAQSRPEIGYVRRAIAAIRQWLRQHVPGLGRLRLSDDEIVGNFLMPARGWVERGGPASVSVGHQGALAYSLAPAALAQAKTRWNGLVDQFVRGGLDETKTYEVLPSSTAVMKLVGLPDLPIHAGGHALDALYNHGVKPSQMKQVLDELANPRMVMVWNKGSRGELSLNFVTSMSNDKGEPFVIAIKPNRSGREGRHHWVATVTQKQPRAIVDMVREGGTLYAGEGDIAGIGRQEMREALRFAKEKRGKEARDLMQAIGTKDSLPNLVQRVLYAKDLAAYKEKASTQGDGAPVFSRSGNDAGLKEATQEGSGDTASWEQAQVSALQSKLDRAIYEFQDGRIDIKRTQEAIERSGQKIEERFDARLAETLMAGRAAYRNQTFLEREVMPLTRVMARLRVSQASRKSPQDFVPSPEGGLDYGEVTPEMGRAMRRQAGKIRLRQGNEAWGLTHIEQRHGRDVAALGYSSVQDFVSKVAHGFTKIYKGRGAALDVVIDNEARGMLIVSLEPSEDGDFYDIKTATPIRRDQFKNEKPLWDRAGPSAPTVQDSSPFPKGQSGSDSVPPAPPAGNPAYSQSMSSGPRVPATKASVHAALRELVNGLGRLPNGLGRVVAATAAEIQRDWEPLIGPVALEASGDAGQAQGFYDPDTKTVFLIADRIPAGQELGVVAHELMHKHGQAVLGEEGWARLHEAIGGWASAPEGSLERRVHDEAAARVRASRPEGADAGAYASQELFPYAVQVAMEMGVRPNLLAKPGTVQNWLARVKVGLREVWGKVTGKPGLFKAQDLVNLAFGIAQRESLEQVPLTDEDLMALPVSNPGPPAPVAMSRSMGGHAFGLGNDVVVADFVNDQPLKHHPDYKAAKAGDADAAVRVVQDLVKQESFQKAREAFGPDAVYLPVHTVEAHGKNKLPNALALIYASKAGGLVDLNVTQTNRAFHTGAGPMERLINRAEFDGAIEAGKRYVLVDDVTTMGSTLADLAAFIHRNGGVVAGSVVMVNAMRGGKISAPPRTIKQLEARHGPAIREILDLDADQLTGPEAQYLIGFKHADEIRDRGTKARHERVARLDAKQALRER